MGVRPLTPVHCSPCAGVAAGSGIVQKCPPKTPAEAQGQASSCTFLHKTSGNKVLKRLCQAVLVSSVWLLLCTAGVGWGGDIVPHGCFCDFFPSLCLSQIAKNPETWKVIFSPRTAGAGRMSLRTQASWRFLGEVFLSELPMFAGNTKSVWAMAWQRLLAPRTTTRSQTLPELQKCLWGSARSKEAIARARGQWRSSFVAKCEMKFSSQSQLNKVSISNLVFVLKIQLSKALWFLCPGPPPPPQLLHKPGRTGLQGLSKIFIYSIFFYTKFRRTDWKEQK